MECPMDDDLFSMFEKRIDEAFEQYDSYFPLLHYALYAPLQGILAEAGGGISCKKGCSRCCSRIVVASRLEALALIDYIYAFTDFDREGANVQIAEHAALLRGFLDERSGAGDGDAVWFEKNIPCPFLRGDICSVYEGRPLSCRLYHSLDDPELCARPVRGVAELPLLSDAEKLFRILARKISARIDPSLEVNGVLTIMMDEFIESGAFKKEDPSPGQ